MLTIRSSYLRIEMSKRILTGIIYALIGVSFLTVSINSQRYLHLDMSKTRSIVGTVTSADPITKLKRGFRFFLTKHYFLIHLNNFDLQFAIDRSGEGTLDLERNIKPGDTLKVYFRDTQSDFNTDVFQVEKNGLVIEPYQSYQNREGNRLGLLLFAGLVSIVASIFYFTNTTPVKFLVYLVEGRNKGSS